MCEDSRLSSVAALREARRRKILENSSSRLKLIEGIKSSGTNTHVAEKCLQSTPQLEIKTPESGSTIIKKSETKINSKLNEYLNENKDLREISNFILRGDTNLDENADEAAETLTFNGKWGKIFFEKKLHYILLAIIVNIMLLFDIGHLFYENIFCPFYTVKLVEVLSKRKTEQLQFGLMLFIAGLPKKLQKLTEVTLFTLSILLSDLCLYLFVFIVGNNLVTSLA